MYYLDTKPAYFQSRDATLDPNHLWLATFQTKYMAGQIQTWLRQAGLFDVWEMELF